MDEQSRVTLEVQNPRGVLESVPVTGLSNPRLSSLDGKRIALLSEKQGSIQFFDAIEALLKERFPTVTVVRFDSPGNPMQPDNTAEVAAACDTWLEGVKTSGSSVMDYCVKLEKLGKPGAPVSVAGLLTQRKRLAEVNGMPTLRVVAVPTLDYMGAEGYPDRMKAVAASAFDSIVDALTAPLTDEEHAAWGRLLDVRAAFVGALEPLRRDGVVGTSAQARAEVEKTAAVAADLATAGLDEARFAELLIVPEVRFLEPEAGSEAGTPVVTAHAAEGTKCPRCWQVKRDGDETGLCARCRGILETGPTAASA